MMDIIFIVLSLILFYLSVRYAKWSDRI